jgi:hypothetical protein
LQHKEKKSEIFAALSPIILEKNTKKKNREKRKTVIQFQRTCMTLVPYSTCVLVLDMLQWIGLAGLTEVLEHLCDCCAAIKFAPSQETAQAACCGGGP